MGEILLFMQLFLEILCGMANIFRSSLIGVCSVCICHFVRHFGVRNFRIFTVKIIFRHCLSICVAELLALLISGHKVLALNPARGMVKLVTHSASLHRALYDYPFIVSV